MRKTAWLVIVFIASLKPAMSGDTLQIQAIKADWDTMLSAPDDAIRIMKSEAVARRMAELLTNGICLKQIMKPNAKYSHLASKDSAIEVITWSVPLLSQGFTYGGVILHRKNESPKCFILQNAKEALSLAELKQYSPQQWFGAVYYQMIEFRHKKQTYYILLGWDGGNFPIARKMIEVLTINSAGEPVFGAPIFAANKIQRKIFEYQQDAYFPLKYERQTYYRKIWYRRKPSPRKENMIVFNRLERERGFAAPIPILNIIDGYRWKDGKLVLMKDLDARNPEKKTDITPKPPERGLFPQD
ncbi:MAG: hypothetical protein HPY80_06610 [Bacteroidales bacterium]|nr:hypothetical protein [Bacteroidales bacterium]